MAIAKGAKSVLAWKTESTYNEAPSGNWNYLPLNSETLDENISTIQGEDIRSDRRNPSPRGGNLASSGQITHDFGLRRTIKWLEHLLAGTAVTTSIFPSDLAATTYKRGDY